MLTQYGARRTEILRCAVRQVKSKKWFTFMHGGSKWTVYVSDLEKMKDFETAQGMSDSWKGEIHISCDLTDECRLAVLGHEFIHVILARSNVETTKALCHSTWKSDKAVNIAEERLCARFGPEMMAIMMSARMIRAPKLRKRAAG